MKNFEENHSQKKTSAYTDEVKEEIIKPFGLLQEIEPLLKEYFIGTFEFENDKIKMVFENGQKFYLSATEIN